MDPEESGVGFSGAGLDRTVRPAAQEQQELKGKNLCGNAGQSATRVEIVEVDSDDSWSSDEDTTRITRGRIAPLEEVGPDEKGSLSHSGGPGAEIEEVVVQPDAAATSTGAACDGKGQDKPGMKRKPRVLGVPRTPTQREMDAHAATHLPHQPWCEVCMMGRARNSQHRRKKEMEATEKETEKGVQLSLPTGTQEEETAGGEPE